MSQRVAITRARPDAERTAERVRALGHEAIVAPLLTIVPCGYDTNTEGAQALIFTSGNGVRAFPDARGARDIPVLTVGDATAQAAREAGFSVVRSAGGDLDALVALSMATMDPRAGRILHFGGAHLAGDFSGQLAQAGFRVERRTAYAAVAAPALPEGLKGVIDIVLFHSPRAAEIFVGMEPLNSALMIAACMSPAVAEAARLAPWRRLVVAQKPHEDALLAAAFTPQDA